MGGNNEQKFKTAYTRIQMSKNWNKVLGDIAQYFKVGNHALTIWFCVRGIKLQFLTCCLDFTNCETSNIKCAYEQSEHVTKIWNQVEFLNNYDCALRICISGYLLPVSMSNCSAKFSSLGSSHSIYVLTSACNGSSFCKKKGTAY